jgi:hypothetical protein
LCGGVWRPAQCAQPERERADNNPKMTKVPAHARAPSTL